MQTTGITQIGRISDSVAVQLAFTPSHPRVECYHTLSHFQHCLAIQKQNLFGGSFALANGFTECLDGLTGSGLIFSTQGTSVLCNSPSAQGPNGVDLRGYF